MSRYNINYNNNGTIIIIIITRSRLRYSDCYGDARVGDDDDYGNGNDNDIQIRVYGIACALIRLYVGTYYYNIIPCAAVVLKSH